MAQKTRGLIELILYWVNDNIVCTSVVNLVAAECFFEFGKAIPGVGWVGTLGGNSPKIKSLDSLVFRI